MEVRHDPVGVVQREVDGDCRAERAVDPADEEHRQEAEGEEHRRREDQLAAEQRRDPVEHLDPGRNRDQERHQREEGQEHRARGEHVVRPDREAEGTDAGRREDERLVAE